MTLDRTTIRRVKFSYYTSSPAHSLNDKANFYLINISLNHLTNANPKKPKDSKCFYAKKMSEKVSEEDIDSEQNYEKPLTLNLVFLSFNTTPKSNLKTKN